MHIVYLTNEFVTEKHFGGLATYLNNIVSIMTDNGHKTTVITLSDTNQVIHYKKNADVIRVKAKEKEMPLSDFEQALLQVENSWRMYMALRKLCKREKVSVIQAASYKAVGFFRNYKVPTIVRVSSDSAFWRKANEIRFDYNQAMSEKNWVDKAELFCIRHADAAFAPSKCCADIVGKRSGRKLQVIESPYQCQDIQVDDSVYQEKLKGKKYVLFNSSLSLLKGTHLGIQAAEHILGKYSDLYMVYVGIDYGIAGKSIAKTLKEQGRRFEGRVIYLSKLSHEQLFPVVENALACVLPSRIDNLPNSCIEAMSLGKIVIGTYGASFEQLIRNKENGLLIERDSKKAFIKAVNYLMCMTEEERMNMGEKAKGTVKRLAPDVVYKQLIEFYENTIRQFES